MDMLKKFKEWIPIIMFVGALALALSTRWGLPPRVDKLEAEMQEQEIKTAQSNATLEAVASDVRDIKNMLMRQK